MRLEINRCPVHSSVKGGKLKGYWSIAIGNGRTGKRLTSGKCCGQWETVMAFNVDPETLIEDIRGEMGCDDCDEGTDASR